ncbi:MAG: hypothetical protein ABI597_06630 [Gammaproteobacteria bacterium]
MDTRPKKSFKLSQLKILNKTVTSGHAISQVTYVQSDGQVKEGYLKYCDSSYPDILAGIVIGISQVIRFAVGSEYASEERLVYDDYDEIIGTLSFTLPNFIPFQSLSLSDTDDKDPEKQAFRNPDLNTLLEYNFARLLVSGYRNKTDDLHPDNISIFGLIDFDMYYYDLTSILKGERQLTGFLLKTPHKICELKEKHIREFPHVPDRTHWVTKAPNNYNLFKIFRAQAILYSLKDNPIFKKQMYTALLQEMLSFDVEMLKKYLQYYLDDEPLILDNLPAVKRDKLIKYNKELFYDDKGNERTIADCCLQLFESEYKAFVRLILHMPEFRCFLIENPGILDQMKAWFREQNAFLLRQNKLDGVPSYLHDLERIEQVYYQICRDSFVTPLFKNLRLLKLYADEVKNSDPGDVLKSMIIIPQEHTMAITPGDEAKELNRSILMIGALPKPNLEGALTIDDNPYQKISSMLNQLYDELYSSIESHYSKKELSFKDQKDLVDRLFKLLEKSNTTIAEYLDKQSSFVKANLQDYAENATTDFRITLNQFLLPQAETISAHETTTPWVSISSVQAIEFKSQVKEIALKDDDIIRTFYSHLAEWMPNLTRTKLDSFVNHCLKEEYKPYGSGTMLAWLNPMAYTKIRDTEIELHLKDSSLTSLGLLKVIFANGKWNDSSFNTILVKYLCHQLLDSFKDNSSVFFGKNLSHKSKSLNYFKQQLGRSDIQWEKHIQMLFEKTPSKAEVSRVTQARSRSGSMIY